MISYVNGTVLEKNPTHVVVLVGGLGYEIFLPLSQLMDVPSVGETCALYTHFVVREDAQQLYGFLHRMERELFRQLIRVNGVGPKMALGMLSGLPARDLLMAFEAHDINRLTQLPGVGKKTAERLLLEFPKNGVTAVQSGHDITSADTSVHDAIAALVELGYKSKQAEKVIHAQTGGALSVEERIRQALRQLSSVE